MRSLVTGGAGFLGSHVVDALRRLRGDEVMVMDDLSGGFIDNIPGKEISVASVTSSIAVESLFSAWTPDYVYHLAAYAAEGLSHHIRRFNYTNNLIGSMNIINACIRHKVKCLVFTSSIAVYGHGHTPFQEWMQPAPEDPYGVAKYAVELDLECARKYFGLPYIIFRPHNVYGERQNIGDPYRNVVGIFMRQIMEGQPCTIFGDGTQMRDFTHVSDVAPLIATSVDNPKAYGQTFNIGATLGCTVDELAQAVQKAMGSDTGYRYLPARQEVHTAVASRDKLEKIFKVYGYVSLADGLSRMAKWVKENGVRKGNKFSNIEIEKGLPEVWRTLS